MKKILFFVLFSMAGSAYAAKPSHSYVRINTEKGSCIVLLYNATPKHRDNFLKLTKQGLYNGTLFHRVIKNFMIQGGDPDSKNAKPGQVLGEGGLDYTVDAEFRDSLFHKKGVLAAARDNNPAKASSSTQFYLVQGKVFTNETLDAVETNRLQGRKLPLSHREVYKTIGGTPHLDQNYTVYGEIILGLDMVDKIATVKTDEKDRPLIDVKMTVSIVKRHDAKTLEKLLPELAAKL